MNEQVQKKKYLQGSLVSYILDLYKKSQVSIFNSFRQTWIKNSACE